MEVQIHFTGLKEEAIELKQSLSPIHNIHKEMTSLLVKHGKYWEKNMWEYVRIYRIFKVLNRSAYMSATTPEI